MAKAKKTMLDQFEQIAPIVITVDKDSTEWTHTKFNFAVNPRDRIGIIVHEFAIDTINLDGFNASGDTILFFLTDTDQVAAYADLSLMSAHVKDAFRWRYFQWGTPANALYEYEGPIMRRNYRDWKGGGILMHASSVYAGALTMETGAPGADVILYGRINFTYVDLDDRAFQELWESSFIPASVT